MLAPSRPMLPRRQTLVHNVAAAMPPVRGLNSSGAVAGMPETDALQMDNFISGDLGVTVREGWFEYATNIDASRPIRTVLSYDGAPAGSTISPLASSTLFASTDFGIWNIEGGGDKTGIAAAIALSGGSSAGRLSSVQFTSDSGGQYLVACSEVDGGFLYNGAAWMKMTSVGGPGPGYVTGVDPALFVQVCAWKRRLLFVQRASAKVWILPVNAVGGAAQVFDFGPLLQHGGAVLALMNWTQDGGDGVDDRLVVLGTSGDLLVYEGTDPTSATEFANVGTWYIGQPPVGRRCFTSSGGSPFVLTTFGVIPVGQVVQGGLDNLLTSSTEYLAQLRKIQDTLNTDFRTLLNTSGWEMLTIPSKALLMIARPGVSVTENVQYAFQQHNLAWSRLLDIPAVTFGRRLSQFYGGTVDGKVLRVLEGATDGKQLDGTNAREIRARLTPAFNYFGTPTAYKQALMARVNFLSAQAPVYSVLMNADFSTTQFASSAAGGAGETVGSLWDASLWDAAFWAGGRAAFGEWRAVEGAGFALAPTVYVSAVQPTTIANYEVMVKAGGPL